MNPVNTEIEELRKRVSDWKVDVFRISPPSRSALLDEGLSIVIALEALVKRAEDAEAVAWALSHDWIIGGYDVGHTATHYWTESKHPSSEIPAYYDITWDGSGIPPVPDEVRAAIAKARGKS